MAHTKEKPIWNEQVKVQVLDLMRPSLFFLLSIVYQEVFLKLYCFKVIPMRGIVCTVLFSLPIALLLGLWCCAVKPRSGHRVLLCVTAVLCIWMATQTVYFYLFKTFLSLSSLVRVGMVAGEFGGLAVANTVRCWFPIAMESLPFAAAVLFRNRLIGAQKAPRAIKVRCVVLAVMLQMAVTLVVVSHDSDAMDLYHIYNQSDAPELTVTNFGVLTNTRLELKRLVFGVQEREEPPENWQDLLQPDEPGQVDYPRPGEQAQVMDIDFGILVQGEEGETVRTMHDHFAQVEPTDKNQWTGYFEGKNLVWIVAEAFSSLAVDPELTPTLYRLSRESFVFQNFYTPLWGLSTSDGEYVTTTGLIPKAGAWSYLESAENYMPFGFGNQFAKRGYRALAYHNNTYTYYGRDQSYPNMGYEYYGLGNGLEVTRSWPESDEEMIQLSVPQYINEERFMVYYLTVSGHLNYNVEQNDMSAKHWDKVVHLPYSEEVKGYLASQIELDRAVESLLRQLEEAGKLEDTVIVLSGDHYPYGLQDEQISELLGHEVDTDFEKFKSTLIVWNAQMKEPVQVDKYCSSLDIMPTLANLFGLEYDSRLLAGRDILSNTPGLVIFYNYSFLSERGAYVSTLETFTPWGEPQEDDGQYLEETLEDIRHRFLYSALILDEDYYRVLFQPNAVEKQE